MRETTRLLKRAGTGIARVAEEAGIGHREYDGGRTTYGVNYVSDMLGGHRPMPDRVRQAIRRLVDKKTADEVLRLADEARKARSG